MKTKQIQARKHDPAALLKGPVGGSATRSMVLRALSEGRVTLAYQPVVDARDTRRVAFHEALVRVRSANGGLLSPAQFLSALAGTSLAATLDREVLRQALAALRRQPDLRLAINVGQASWESDGWLGDLADATRQAPDLGYRMIVELAEDGKQEDPARTRFVAELHRLGVSVALDDFGAGRTGFAQFRKQRFDIVKIDGSYGDGLARDRDAQALVRALVDLARHFEMVSVIEFIANPEDAACARRLGVDAMQGNLYGPPLDALPGEGPTTRRAVG